MPGDHRRHSPASLAESTDRARYRKWLSRSLSQAARHSTRIIVTTMTTVQAIEPARQPSASTGPKWPRLLTLGLVLTFLALLAVIASGLAISLANLRTVYGAA